MMPYHEAEKEAPSGGGSRHDDIEAFAMAMVEELILVATAHGKCSSCIAKEVVLLIMEQFMCRFDERDEAIAWLTGDFVQDVLTVSQASMEETYGKRH